MFIPKQAWNYLYDSLGELERSRDTERLKREQLEKELAIERNNADWLRTQCNVANARADALFTQFTNARLPTPVIEKSTATANADEAMEMTKGGALPALEDPGDDIAQRLGIDHAEDGTLVYR